MKAVIAGVAPGAPLIDITHEIPPQHLAAGSFVLAAAVRYLPDDAVVWAVVDPGVGTARHAVVVGGRVDGRRVTFIAPDNGLLTECLASLADVTVARLDDPRFHLAHPSATFHGRDVFAPAAAHAALGTAATALGTAQDPDDLVRLALPPVAREGHGWSGTIRWVDRFGNLVTNIPAEIARDRSWRIRAGDATIDGVSHTFGSVADGEGVAYVGSWGMLEVAVRGGDGAVRWGLGIGDPVSLEAG